MTKFIWPMLLIPLQTSAQDIAFDNNSTTVPRTIVVAVIDTGLSLSHPEFKGKIYRAPSSEPIHSAVGKNFSGEGTIEDVNGHGTHIASIITREDERGRRPQVQLLPLKYYHSAKQKKDPLIASTQALRYALSQEVDIVNYSGGGYSFSQEEYDILKQMNDQGILVIAAAGNEGMNIDERPFYPASYDLPNIISVSSLDESRKPLASSNRGARNVDISALGKNIWAALPAGRFGQLSGTSQATAQVTKAVVLMMQNSPERLPPAEVKRRLLITAKPNENLAGFSQSEGQLNIDRSLFMRDRHDPLPHKLTQTENSLR